MCKAERRGKFRFLWTYPDIRDMSPWTNGKQRRVVRFHRKSAYLKCQIPHCCVSPRRSRKTHRLHTAQGTRWSLKMKWYEFWFCRQRLSFFCIRLRQPLSEAPAEKDEIRILYLNIQALCTRFSAMWTEPVSYQNGYAPCPFHTVKHSAFRNI